MIHCYTIHRVAPILQPPQAHRHVLILASSHVDGFHSESMMLQPKHRCDCVRQLSAAVMELIERLTNKQSVHSL